MAHRAGYLAPQRKQFAFFDEPAVVNAVGNGVRRALSKWGSYVRRSARHSIVKRKNAVSKPGRPPYSHVGKLRNNIYFGFDKASKTCVVGATLQGTARNLGATVPETLEKGSGAVTVGRFPNRQKALDFLVGGKDKRAQVMRDGVWIESGPPFTESDLLGKYAPIRPDGNWFKFVLVKRKTQVRRAIDLFYSRTKERRVPIAARPFMVPAMEKNLNAAKMCFINCIKDK